MKLLPRVWFSPVCLTIALGVVQLSFPLTSAASGESYVLAAPPAQKQAVSLSVPAEALIFEVALLSNDDDWETRLREVEAVRVQLETSAAKAGLRLVTKRAADFGTAGGKFSSLVSSGGNPDLSIRSTLMLVAALDDRSDLVAIVRNVRQVLSKLARPKGITMRLGEARLGIEDPEKFRPTLLAKIRAHLDATAHALGNDVEAVVTGLDEPVRAQQSDERGVELSLPLRATYTRKSK